MRRLSEELLFDASTPKQWRVAIEKLYKRPARRRDLNKELRECFVLQSFLRSANGFKPTFPISVHFGDRPEFRLAEQDRQTGIEVTSVTNRQLEVTRNAVDDRGTEIFQTSNEVFRSNRHRRLDEKALILSAEDVRNSPGWIGHDPEDLIVSEIDEAWRKKLTTFTKPDFQTFGRNLLLIYYNGSAPPLGERGWTTVVNRLSTSEVARSSSQEAWTLAGSVWVRLN